MATHSETDPQRSSVAIKAISGPTPVDRVLEPGGRVLIGRSLGADICLVEPSVSREHARMAWRHEGADLTDLGSAGGTWVNGIQIPAGQTRQIGAGDLITIGPWTLRLLVAGSPATAVPTIDDTASREVKIERISRPAHATLAEQRLQLLIECIAGFNTADDTAALARSAVHAALNGTPYRRAAVLRSAAGPEQMQVLATLQRDDGPDAGGYSRSLVREALGGHTAALSTKTPTQHSIIEMGISSALCVPIRVGPEVEAVLYLDSRRGERTLDPSAAGYCEAVARACGLAMASLRRAELERHAHAAAQEMGAARAVQRLLIAPEAGRHGDIEFAARVRPGLAVAGDLFDVLPLSGGRVAAVIGDVSGHGLGPGIVMAMTQSHLHAQLMLRDDPGDVLDAVNRFVCSHVEAGRFVSLWIGIIHPDGMVDVVDAGHGHAAIVRRGSVDWPTIAGGVPLGVDPESRYRSERLSLGRGERLVLFSDGIIEQRSASGDEFGRERLAGELLKSQSCDGDVSGVFAAMERFGEGLAASDDATLASLSVRNR